jgi:hypothetical protein
MGNRLSKPKWGNTKVVGRCAKKKKSGYHNKSTSKKGRRGGNLLLQAVQKRKGPGPLNKAIRNVSKKKKKGDVTLRDVGKVLLAVNKNPAFKILKRAFRLF